MSVTQDVNQSQLSALDSAFKAGEWDQLGQLLHDEDLPLPLISHFLEATPANSRLQIWSLLREEARSGVLPYLPEEVRSQFIASMSAEEIVDSTSEFDQDDLADLLQELPAEVLPEVLEQLPDIHREGIEELMSYAEDSAGGLMDKDIITVRANSSIKAVRRYLRRFENMPETLDSLFVVNRNHKFVGMLPIMKLIVHKGNTTVREVMESNIEAINAKTSDDEVARQFERYDWVSAPVVDDSGKLLGRITIDDVVDVIRDQGEHNILSMAGLDEASDTLAPVWQSSKDRAVWLGINLVTACLAALVIGLFEESIQKNSILSLLMGIVASMGGVAGSQTLTLVIRGYAIGQLSGTNFRWLLMREIGVAMVNGVIWALVAGFFTYIWKQDLAVAAIMAAAVICTLMVAKISGAILPMLLRKAGIDPALSGSVILTTITDIVGFFTFLSMATWLLF